MIKLKEKNFKLLSPNIDFSQSGAILYFDRKHAWFSLGDSVEGSISGVMLINKSCFIVAYSYAHCGAPSTRGRTGSGYVESEPVMPGNMHWNRRVCHAARHGRKNRRERTRVHAADKKKKKKHRTRWLRARPTHVTRCPGHVPSNGRDDYFLARRFAMIL